MLTLRYPAFMAALARTQALASANQTLGLVWVLPDGRVWGTVKATPQDDPYVRVPPDAVLVVELEPYQVSQDAPASKADPSPFEGFHKAEPDEPYFTLLARDSVAPVLVKQWAEISSQRGDQPTEQILEARRVASAMESWRRAKEETIGLQPAPPAV